MDPYKISNSEIIERSLSYSFCILSLIGEVMIISSVFRSKRNRENIQQRILGCMSISDVILVSLRLTGFIWAPKKWKQGNLGSKYSCDIQGFIFGIAYGATTSYNFTLALYYLLVIRYNWNPSQLKTIQKYFFIIPIVAGIPGSIFASIFDIFNIRSNPYDSCFGGPDAVPLMSEGFAKYYVYIGTCALSGMIVFNLTCMALVDHHVRKTEKNSLQCSSNDEGLQRMKVVQTQFRLFTLAFLTTSIFQVLSKVIAFTGAVIPSALNTVSLVLLHTNGFLNALVYFRLRFRRIRKDNPDWQRVPVLVYILKDTLLPSFAQSCCGSKREINFEDLEPTLYNSSNLNGDGDDIEEQKDQSLISKLRIHKSVQRLAATEGKRACRSENNGNGSSTLTTTSSATSYLDDNKKKSHTVPKHSQKTSFMREDWRALKAAGVQTSNSTLKSNENKADAQKQKSLRSMPDEDIEPKNSQKASSMREDWRALKAAGVQTSNSTLKSNENKADAQKQKSLRSIPDIDTQSQEEEEAWVDLNAFHTETMSKKDILRTSMREEWRALKAAGVQTSNNALKRNDSVEMDAEPSKIENTNHTI